MLEPPARWMAPSTPPPPRSPEFAALTMASTRILVISPITRRSFFPFGKSISMLVIVSQAFRGLSIRSLAVAASMRRPPVSSTNLVAPPTVVIPDQREAYSLPNFSLGGMGLVFGRVTHTGDLRPTGGVLPSKLFPWRKGFGFWSCHPQLVTSDQREAYSLPNVSL